MSRSTKRFSETEQLEIVKESFEGTATVVQIAHKYGIHTSSLNRWRSRFRHRHLPATSVPGSQSVGSPDLVKQNALLRKQLKQAELERDILKKAISIFSKTDGKSSAL